MQRTLAIAGLVFMMATQVFAQATGNSSNSTVQNMRVADSANKTLGEILGVYLSDGSDAHFVTVLDPSLVNNDPTTVVRVYRGTITGSQNQFLYLQPNCSGPWYFIGEGANYLTPPTRVVKQSVNTYIVYKGDINNPFTGNVLSFYSTSLVGFDQVGHCDTPDVPQSLLLIPSTNAGSTISATPPFRLINP